MLKSNKIKNEKKQSKFLKSFLIYSAVLAAICLFSLLRVRGLLIKYENSQPDFLIAATVDKLNEKAKENNLFDFIAFKGIGYSKYDLSAGELESEFSASVASGQMYYKPLSSTSGGESKKYLVYNDDRDLFHIEISSEKTYTKLFVFSFTEWEISSITPVLTISDYSYSLMIPDGFKVFVNGLDFEEAPASTADGVGEYKLSGLRSAPEFTVIDPYGNPCAYDISDNTLTVVTYGYTFSLPEYFYPAVNGMRCKGTAKEDGTMEYCVKAGVSPEIYIHDLYGNSALFSENTKITDYTYTLTLPSNFKLLSIGASTEDFPAFSTKENDDYKYIKEYCASLPSLNVYALHSIAPGLDIKYEDNTGTEKNATIKSGANSFTSQTGTHAPDKTVDIDVIKAAETWSLFMSDDLAGELHGFYELKKLLINNSYLYDVANKWARGIDITFISDHDLLNPPFENQKAENFVFYSDTCFSCNIYLEKRMRLSSGKYQTDIINSTFYFVFTDDTDDGVVNPHWAIADFKEIIG